MANGGRWGISLIDLNNQYQQPCWKMNDVPIYVSKRTAKSLWQEYRIFRDRTRTAILDCFSTPLVISAGEIRESRGESVHVFSGRKGFTWGMKIDNCDFCRHVLLTRKSGLFKRIAFLTG